MHQEDRSTSDFSPAQSVWCSAAIPILIVRWRFKNWYSTVLSRGEELQHWHGITIPQPIGFLNVEHCFKGSRMNTSLTKSQTCPQWKASLNAIPLFHTWDLILSLIYILSPYGKTTSPLSIFFTHSTSALSHLSFSFLPSYFLTHFFPLLTIFSLKPQPYSIVTWNCLAPLKPL